MGIQGTLPFDRFGDDFKKKARELGNSVDRKIPIQVGELMVDGFRESFDLQRFNDTGTAPWQEVQRRIPGSPWYGFALATNDRLPRGFKSPGAGSRGGKSNFSQRATTRNILLGKGSSNLRDSIFLASARAGRIIVASDQPHAEVHNEGLEAKIFGKKIFKMPKRQFMGNSARLIKDGFKLIDHQIRKIL